ncbi:MAG: hypothetical protein CMC35_07880 [Flavobacteriaceae bacterium]|nr:hypothetical protein [Flavobacteriaceae bacterium]|tara:strand:+ start:8241 stop:8651 length:411 start_codon:yes stop_codon:yes gene_type:complete
MKTRILSTAKPFSHLFFFGIMLLLAFMVTTSATAQEQKRTVTGIVKSTDGPVFGATVVLKGTAIGVVTDEKGGFTFPEALAENDVLVVSFLGYETAEVIISDQTTFVTPFLADNPVIIKTAIRTRNTSTTAEVFQH